MSVNKQLWRKLPCLLLLVAATCSVLVAQNPRFESLTIADGLSQGMIYDIEQTDDGFLWFGTKDGLNRYDGYRFEVFTNDPFNPFSIAGNDIHHLFEDSRGNSCTDLYFTSPFTAINATPTGADTSPTQARNTLPSSIGGLGKGWPMRMGGQPALVRCRRCENII